MHFRCRPTTKGGARFFIFRKKISECLSVCVCVCSGRTGEYWNEVAFDIVAPNPIFRKHISVLIYPCQELLFICKKKKNPNKTKQRYVCVLSPRQFTRPRSVRLKPLNSRYPSTQAASKNRVQVYGPFPRRVYI